MARMMGNTKIQKIASGSRRNRRNRVVVSWRSELAAGPVRTELEGLGLGIAQVPSGQTNEDVFERGRVGSELTKMRAHLI